EVQRGSSLSFSRNFPSGSLSFTALGPSTAQSGGDAFASFLLGFVDSASLSDAPEQGKIMTGITGTWYYAPWVQDQWRARPNLTLNIGLRWEIDTAWQITNGFLSGFDPNAINPVSGTPGVVTFSSTGTWQNASMNTHWKAFSPRLGFAWKPMGS